ncbi:MAG: agmatinase [Candidatus Melainabacteria bacterium GWF2_37_15]|nr:MAG: agmatinase [Candidatus Melainabacteria bacterium GWF2_37_15]
MLTGPFLSKNWMASTDNFNKADIVMVGLPYDGTCCSRPGARFGPADIRLSSIDIETYSPVFKKDLTDIKFYDAGELEFQFGNREDTLLKIEKAAQETFSHNKKWLGIGGEHLITLPALKACYKKYPELSVIHFDAHADLNDTYLNESLCHSTVIRRTSEFIKSENIAQIGIHSGTKEEYEWIEQHNTLVKTPDDLLKKVKNKPVYLTIDLDVLDPSVLPGTGTPEPGGMSFNELIEWFITMQGLNIVGADVVELSPHYDSSKVSSITAAKVIREVLFLIN